MSFRGQSRWRVLFVGERGRRQICRFPALALTDSANKPSAGPTPAFVPESSTWAMMLLGFAGLALAGYRRAKAGPRNSNICVRSPPV
jgi:hypothetical protein